MEVIATIQFATVVASGASGPVSAQSGVVGAGAASTLPDCPVQLAGRGAPSSFPTEPFECYCSAKARGLRGGYAFGSGPYEGINNICMAALHAGVIGREGGDVRVIPGPIQESFKGSLVNGVFSSD